MGANRGQRGPMGANGGQRGPMGANGDTGANGGQWEQWGPMGANGGQWGPMGANGRQWKPAGANGCQWGLMGCHGNDESRPMVHLLRTVNSSIMFCCFKGWASEQVTRIMSNVEPVMSFYFSVVPAVEHQRGSLSVCLKRTHCHMCTHTHTYAHAHVHAHLCYAFMDLSAAIRKL
jgi:hypothetical protein